MPPLHCTVTWLGVGVVHSVAIQLEQLHRLGLLLSVAAHGKRVLTDLHQGEDMFPDQLNYLQEKQLSSIHYQRTNN